MKMKYLISILMMYSCVLTKVNAQQYQMEALDPEKNSNVIFYSDPETDTMSMSLKNVDSLRVVLPQPSEVAYLRAIEVRLKDNDDLRLFVEQHHFPKERQAFLKELKNIEVAKLKVNQEKILSERENNLINKYGKEIADKIINGKVWVGMTEDMLIESCGAPEYINTTTTDKGVLRKYAYQRHFYNCYGYTHEYLYFEDGKCIQIKRG